MFCFPLAYVYGISKYQRRRQLHPLSGTKPYTPPKVCRLCLFSVLLIEQFIQEGESHLRYRKPNYLIEKDHSS